MTNKAIACEVYLAMNEDGDWIVTNDESAALEDLCGGCGGYQGRVVKITVRMTPPVMDECTVDVPTTAGTVAAAE